MPRTVIEGMILSKLRVTARRGLKEVFKSPIFKRIKPLVTRSVCVCVCVCRRERERDADREERERQIDRDRVREKNTKMKNSSRKKK